MHDHIELETDAVDQEQLIDWATDFDTCNGFAFWYLENVNENAVVKDGLAFGRDEHCYVYDPSADVTIDATCGQFDDAPFAGAWDGDDNPVIDDRDEIYQWTDREAFAEHYSQHPNGPFIV